MATITNPMAIHSLQIRTQMQAVKLEKIGMRRKGGNLTPKLKKFYRLPRNATHDDVLRVLEDHLEIVNKKYLASALSEDLNS